LASVWTLPSVEVVSRSAPGSSATARPTLACSEPIAWKTWFADVISVRICGRLEPREHVLQRPAVVVQAGAGALHEQRQVVARVLVERTEDLIGVDVGQRARDRDRPAGPRDGCRVAAGGQLDEHVLQAGLRAQQRARVLMDEPLVLRVDRHRHDRVAALEVDLADVADPHARDADRLALARRDRLGGREVGLQLER
jgi:hypothetical protein